MLNDIIRTFSELKGEAFAQYKYQNHWVYEELSVIFNSVYAIGSLAYLRQQKKDISAKELLDGYNPKMIPEPFHRIMLQHKAKQAA